MASHNHAGRAEAALAAVVSCDCVCAIAGTVTRPILIVPCTQALCQLTTPGNACRVFMLAERQKTAQEHAGLVEAALASVVSCNGISKEECALQAPCFLLSAFMLRPWAFGCAAAVIMHAKNCTAGSYQPARGCTSCQGAL